MITLLFVIDIDCDLWASAQWARLMVVDISGQLVLALGHTSRWKNSRQSTNNILTLTTRLVTCYQLMESGIWIKKTLIGDCFGGSCD